ncbi:MAG: hypothetical protein K0R77_648 [Chryseobacterium sp.]|jgi:uncharacterized membrane protein|uniref:hypothetical protein n=1 Tax=Chryseobacterium sp. TaxID=1871047 RepID=UPI00262110FA|nr:hypothetical protein [Chryseobacterium sp.]MDF2551373.1 hypothetical protein [Chryseobacterium sp.]
MTKKELLTWIILTMLIMMLPISFFLYNFYDSEISDDIGKWGAFGDYFGGLLNCTFSLLSVIVTIYIALKLSNIEKNRNRDNLKFEKEKLLREFRESEYKRINFELQKVWSCVTDSNREDAIRTLASINWQYRYFMTSNYHLFPFLADNEITNLHKTLQEIINLFWKEKSFEEKEEIIGKFTKDFDALNMKMQTFLLKN